MRKIPFYVTIFFVLLLLSSPKDAAAHSICIPWGESKYSNIDVALIKKIRNDSQNVTEFERAALAEGVQYFANPLTQLMIAQMKIHEGSLLGAVAYAEVSSHLSSKEELCSNSNLEFLALATRRQALILNFTDSEGHQEFYSLTYGLANKNLELLSQQFKRAEECLSSAFLSRQEELSFDC